MVDTRKIDAVESDSMALYEAAERRSELAAQAADAEGEDPEEHERLAGQVAALELAMAQHVSSLFEPLGEEAQVALWEDLSEQFSTRTFIETSKKAHKARNLGYM